ncbi:hypothetical protein BJ742DRAFT_830252 [Cladochytrium replicatum]|nr:hypothetical protein BJ742DRAFT_830252 [Cladochytrium replicatum]
MISLIVVFRVSFLDVFLYSVTIAFPASFIVVVYEKGVLTLWSRASCFVFPQFCLFWVPQIWFEV